jgi:predicted DNA-binding transcriptional regulator AlpA
LGNPESDKLEKFAASMGISLYQQFNKNEAALFLRCSVSDINTLTKQNKINYIEVTKSKQNFFGYQLLEFLLEQATNNPVNTAPPPSNHDQIIRAKEVQEMTRLSRTTLWRMENKGEFPRRVSLGGNSVGWKLSEVSHWIDNR